MSRQIYTILEEGIFTHRRWVLALFTVITLLLCYPASQLRIEAGFEKHLPLQHPYIQTFLEYQQEFGGANRLLITIRAKQGDIFTSEFFETAKAVTNDVLLLPGVDRSTVRSLFTSNVRFIEVVHGGFAGGPIIPPDFQPTSEGIAQVRENILKSGSIGRLVANDFSAVNVISVLLKIDPTTGERLDYLQLSEDLEKKIRDKYAQGNIDIHIIGFAKLIGDIANGALGAVQFFGIALFVTGVLVYLFIHSLWLTMLLLLCSIVAVLWTLGLLTLLGLGLDAFWILVPFLIFAIGVSHGVQMINAVGSEVYKGTDSLTAARHAFRRLLIPSVIALISDTIGFLTILLIEIGILQELAMTVALGLMVIILTNLFLLPVLVSYIHLDQRYRERLARSSARKISLWRLLSRLVEPKVAVVSIICASMLLIFGLIAAQNLKIGDLQAGVPELHPDSRYNSDTAMITEKFSIAIDVLTVIVETDPDGCSEYHVMEAIDRLQWQAANIEGVQSTLSMPHVAKVINAKWNEDHLKWRVLPRNQQAMAQAISSIEPSTGLLNHDCSVMPVLIFLKDHKANTIERVVDTVKAFATKNNSERVTFRLAAGNGGIMAATNEVVEEVQVRMLLWIYAAISTLCLAAFRSWRAAFCIVAPLGLVSVIAYAVMTLLDIGLKVSTLPVVVLGVGIGVDYGIYIFSRLNGLLNEGIDLHEAYLQTLRVTGNAVLVTGLTLAAGVSTWAFSALKFQADMGLLLAFMFIANMLGALILLPALASFVYHPFGRKPS